MQACDFHRSFFWFEVDLSKKTITVTAKQPVEHIQVRIPLECRCEITDANGATTPYILSASCKTEKVAVEQDIWMIPNADFCVVSSLEDFMIVKRWQQCDMSIERESSAMAPHVERQVGLAAEAWASHKLDVVMVDAEELTTDASIVAAVHARRTIVARTEFVLDGGGRCLIEHPVKTINVSDRHMNYQIDTGPVLFPDLSIGHERFIGNFRLAYIAHCRPEWAELVVNVPTSIDGGAQVNHFSRPVRVEGKNTMFAVD